MKAMLLMMTKINLYDELDKLEDYKKDLEDKLRQLPSDDIANSEFFNRVFDWVDRWNVKNSKLLK